MGTDGYDISSKNPQGFAAYSGLLGTRFTTMSPNTIEYWRLPQSTATEAEIKCAYAEAKFVQDGNLQVYLHVPFCPQKCRFCAFSGANSLDFRTAERYVDLLAAHIKNLLKRSEACGQHVRSLFIGGGSPDLLGNHINGLLQLATSLPGITEQTEIGCECALLTVSKSFIDALIRNGTTRLSFGIQSFDPQVRIAHRLHGLDRLDIVLTWAYKQIPVINADLITGLPGQTLKSTLADLLRLMADPRINAITTYDFSPANAPSVVAGLRDSTLPACASWNEQVLMRLHSYTTLMQHGWVRRGTNTYVHPARMSSKVFERISGNESIATDRYESFLIGAGPSAKSHVPGLRMEECNNLDTWSTKVEQGELPLHLPSCACRHQRDLALWLFPLRYEGLSFRVFDAMITSGAITSEQRDTFNQLMEEGLIIPQYDAYHLSILGEVFMGHLVRDLKNTDGKVGFDKVNEESQFISLAMLDSRVADRNAANDRQGSWLANVSTRGMPGRS